MIRVYRELMLVTASYCFPDQGTAWDTCPPLWLTAKTGGKFYSYLKLEVFPRASWRALVNMELTLEDTTEPWAKICKKLVRPRVVYPYCFDLHGPICLYELICVYTCLSIPIFLLKRFVFFNNMRWFPYRKSLVMLWKRSCTALLAKMGLSCRRVPKCYCHQEVRPCSLRQHQGERSGSGEYRSHTFVKVWDQKWVASATLRKQWWTLELFHWTDCTIHLAMHITFAIIREEGEENLLIIGHTLCHVNTMDLKVKSALRLASTR